MNKRFTPPALARLWGIKPDKIIRAIRRGELPGTIDVADPESSRPRYLIPPSAIQAFERRRAVVDLRKRLERFSADALSWRIGREEIRKLRFEINKLLVEPVVLAVADDGRGVLVI
jgi:hypothetical protein